MSVTKDLEIHECDLCVVGTGLAGLNALYVASKYLSKKEKVIVIDKRKATGGMWNSTYNHVRLHQPHKLFTAGNIAWKLNKPAAHLASRTEILDQFDNCWQQLNKNLNITHLAGLSYESHEETQQEDGSYTAKAQFSSSDDESKKV
ncbi:MAG: NAD(P)-binding protein, partial [Bacteroidota bacterium]